MPPISIPRPSDIVKCEDIASCFQALYNLFFALLIVLAFIYFLYGAFQYLLSAGGIFQKEEGKKKMINSIIAVIVALGIPIILNMINPGIFQTTIKIPKVEKIVSPEVLDFGTIEMAEMGKNVDLIPEEDQKWHKPIVEIPVDSTKICPPCIKNIEECDIFKVFGEYVYKPRVYSTFDYRRVIIKNNEEKIIFKQNDPPPHRFHEVGEFPPYVGTEYVHPYLKGFILRLADHIPSGVKVIVTDGFSMGDHASKCHTQYGVCIDIVVTRKNGTTTNEDWEEVIEAARKAGFWVLDERFKKGSEYWSGSHLHLQVTRPGFLRDFICPKK